MSMGTRGGSLFGPTRPTVAIGVTSRRVTVAAVAGSGRSAMVTHAATVSLPDGLVAPALAGTNIASRADLAAALRTALDQAGLRSARRAALIVPDSIARVSLVELEQLPSRTTELDRILRWQLRKSLPFPVGEARLSHFVAHTSPGRTTLAVVLARADVLAEYEAAADAIGVHAGIVDLASLNVANAVLTAGPAAGDSLLVSLAPDATTLLLLRGNDLMFYRHRAGASEESVGALVHQTAMFHVDRLGGAKFDRVLVAGGDAHPADVGRFRAEIGQRLDVVVDTVDVRQLVALKPPRLADVNMEALVALVGVLLREAKAA